MKLVAGFVLIAYAITAPFETGVPAARAQASLTSMPKQMPDMRDWPQGKGLDQLAHDCSGCHSPAWVKGERHDAAGWDTVIGMMIERGAKVSNDDRAAIRDYLSSHFGAGSAGAR